MEKLRLIASMDILPGFEEDVKEAITTLGTATHKEPGSELFEIHTRNDSPNSIIVYEVYANENAFEMHRAEPYAAEFFEFVKGKIKDDKIEIVYLTKLNS